MNGKAVDIVLVGCGAVSDIMYTPALHVLEDEGVARVEAIVDPSQRQLTKIGHSFPKAERYRDLSSCPLRQHQLVIVATPPSLHAEQSIHALRHGASVLCEKPIALSSAEAENMIEAARQSGSILAVGIYRRFYPAFAALKEVIDKKPLGELRSFAIHEGGKFGWGAVSDSFFRRDRTLGGVFFDVGVYIVDLLLWWLGEPSAFTYEDDAMGGLEANCRLDLVYPHDIHGTVRLSRDWPTQNTYTFTFERGEIAYQVGHANRLAVLFNGLSLAIDGELTTCLKAPGTSPCSVPTLTTAQSFTEQLRNVVAAMRGEQVLRVSGHDALRSLAFVERCYRERRLMEMPWLTPQERSVAAHVARQQ